MTWRWNGRNSIYILVIFILAAGACTDQPESLNPEIQHSQFFRDYRITGDDESGHITVLVQFREGGPDGPGILLDTTGAVIFDGYRLDADSSRNHGTYYEQRWLASEFDGTHELRFVRGTGDTLVEQFDYPVFGFAQPFPEKVPVADLEIELTGLSGNDSLHILLLDTAYKSRGIDRYITLKNNTIILTAEDLGRLRKGPIVMDIYRDVEQALTDGEETSGRLAISFALRRRFVLE